MSNLLLFNKPFNVLCQFTDASDSAHDRETLAEYITLKGFYAAGRLDRDSEGLLLLTDDGQLQHQISDPKHKLPKTYWAQVEGTVTPEAIQQLQLGILLKDGMTRPAHCKHIEEPDVLWPRNPPIRERKNIPTSWIELTITEGKNRQVRRMTAAVGFPTLRLIRVQIGPWRLTPLQPGESKLLTAQSLPSSAQSKQKTAQEAALKHYKTSSKSGANTPNKRRGFYGKKRKP